MRFSTADEAFEYIEAFTNLEKTPNLTAREYRLDRMFLLAELFGNPQKSFKSIHVAGSKGKGSVSAFLAAALSANGYNTGLYCSPHVASYKERISSAGVFFDDRLYADTAEEMLNLVEKKIQEDALPGGHPTAFELLTLLSFLIFSRAGCEWVVFETGLGGRLDATNVIMPEASVLTIIELEHTEFLGDTIAEIAGEKAGIIKPGVPVFSADQTAEAEEVFRTRANRNRSDIYFPDDLIHQIVRLEPAAGFSRSYEIRLQKGRSCRLDFHLPGEFKIKNASLAVEVLSKLMPDSFDLAAGMSEMSLPGRMELLAAETPQGSVPVILDGAHTVESVRSASQAFFEYISPAKDAVLVFGAVSGKDVAGMASLLCGKFKKIIISKPGSFKINDPDEVFRTFSAVCGFGSGLELLTNPETALETAAGYGLPVLVCGSFYMVAEIRKFLA